MSAPLTLELQLTVLAEETRRTDRDDLLKNITRTSNNK